MPELPDRIDGEIIEAAHMNEATIRSVQRYASIAERDSLNPAPENGQPAWIIDVGELQIWDGAKWKGYLPLTGGDMTGGIVMKSEVPSHLWWDRDDATVPWRMTQSSDGNLRIQRDTGSGYASVMDFTPEDGAKFIGSSAYNSQAVFHNTARTHWFKFIIASDNSFRLQSSEDGVTWTTVETWQPTVAANVPEEYDVAARIADLEARIAALEA